MPAQFHALEGLAQCEAGEVTLLRAGARGFDAGQQAL